MNLFGKKKAQTATTPVTATIPETHVSKKKKNTYTIAFSALYDATLYSMCPNTPLGVVILNGQAIKNNSGWISCTEFPNPCATRMAANQKILTEALGPKLSTQIIEYLDKNTGQPVVQLYPDSIHIFDGYEENYMSHLNHATCRDLEKQIALRNRLLDEFIAKQNQNQK